MGRPRKYEIDKYVELWDSCRSNREVARILGVDEKTVRNNLKEAGIQSPMGNNSGCTIKKWSMLAEWCRKHPNEILSRDMKVLMEMTGLSRSTIKCFFYRRKRKMMKRKLSRNQKLKARNGKNRENS